MIHHRCSRTLWMTNRRHLLASIQMLLLLRSTGVTSTGARQAAQFPFAGQTQKPVSVVRDSLVPGTEPPKRGRARELANSDPNRPRRTAAAFTNRSGCMHPANASALQVYHSTRRTQSPLSQQPGRQTRRWTHASASSIRLFPPRYKPSPHGRVFTAPPVVRAGLCASLCTHSRLRMMVADLRKDALVIAWMR
jgi:hypothetical protein